jgi:hypothetical protein
VLRLLHIILATFSSFLLAEAWYPDCVPSKTCSGGEQLSWSQVLEESVGDTKITEYLRFVAVNMVVSVLLLLVLILAGIPVMAEYSLGGVSCIVPAYVGYLGISQLIVTSLFLLRIQGYEKTYRWWLTVLASSITVSLLISVAGSMSWTEQLLLFWELVPSLYFRNGLATSLFCISLLGVAYNDVELIGSRRRATLARNLILLIVIGWAFHLLPLKIDMSFPVGYLASFTLVYLYPFASAVVFFAVTFAWLKWLGLGRIATNTILPFSLAFATIYCPSIAVFRIALSDLELPVAGSWAWVAGFNAASQSPFSKAFDALTNRALAFSIRERPVEEKSDLPVSTAVRMLVFALSRPTLAASAFSHFARTASHWLRSNVASFRLGVSAGRCYKSRSRQA